MRKLTFKEKQILEMLKDNKDLVTIIRTLSTDSDMVYGVMAYIKARQEQIKNAKRPPNRLYMPLNSMYIHFDGRKLTKNVSPLYRGKAPSNQRWSDIERKALVRQAIHFLPKYKTYEAMCKHIAPYFMRTPKALYSELHRIESTPKEWDRLNNLYNKR